jgi:putative redox protein
MAKPPLDAALTWTGNLNFTASSGTQRITLDGNSADGTSPMQALAFAISGCMAMDVVEILRKGRYSVNALDVQFHGERAQEPPHRFTGVTLTFIVSGDVPGDAVRRAIALSHEKYCSVSNSLRGDIAFVTEFEVRP